MSDPQAHAPALPLELWAFEACPYCRKVREVLAQLDLEYVCRPCARGSGNRRLAPQRLDGRRRTYPILADPNTGRTLPESAEIVLYLLDTYGDGQRRGGWAVAAMSAARSALARAARPGRGAAVLAGSAERGQPARRLVLHASEGSAAGRLVRERLCELDLDHHVKRALGGSGEPPTLIDPNTGVSLLGPRAIVAYLDREYRSPSHRSPSHRSPSHRSPSQ